jgi:ribosomal protein S18 acetylase RimI-like enzyme
MITKKVFQNYDLVSFIEIEEFIKSNIDGNKSFRYYSKRPYTIIKNHLYTCLYYIDNLCVGYGHLDYENGKIWLGIMVSDNHKGKKIGDKIMDDLITNSSDDIYLSVDIKNQSALNLYIKKGFKIVEENINYYLMELKK